MSSKRLSIVFMGTPQFAVPSLQALADHHDVVAVVTAPDKPAGRGKKLSESDVKRAAANMAADILQPEKLKDPAFLGQIEAYNADLFVVVAFRMLPKEVWSMPHKGTINLHASLLPAYRGAAPINRAIMNGETVTGLSTFFIEEQIDTGEVIEQTQISIGPDEDAGSLHDRMMHAGAQLLLSTVSSIANDSVKSTPQQELFKNSQASPAPKIFKDDCRIPWNLSASVIHNHVRGLSPAPGAWTVLQDVKNEHVTVKIFQVQPHAQVGATHEVGRLIVEKNRLMVQCGDGLLEVLQLQLPGKRRMAVAELLNGYQFLEGASFERFGI